MYKCISEMSLLHYTSFFWKDLTKRVASFCRSHLKQNVLKCNLLFLFLFLLLPVLCFRLSQKKFQLTTTSLGPFPPDWTFSFVFSLRFCSNLRCSNFVFSLRFVRIFVVRILSLAFDLFETALFETFTIIGCLFESDKFKNIHYYWMNLQTSWHNWNIKILNIWPLLIGRFQHLRFPCYD